MVLRVVGRKAIQKELDRSISLGELRKSLDLHEDQYISLLNGNPATDDEIATENDEVVFLEVFSGG